MTEFVRQRLARYISSRLKADDDQIHVITCDGALEEAFRGHIQQIDGDFHLGIAAHLAERLIGELEQRMNDMSMMGLQPVFLVSPELRRPVRNLLERFLPQLMVISHKEVAHGIQIQAEGEVGVGIAELMAPPVPQGGGLNLGASPEPAAA